MDELAARKKLMGVGSAALKGVVSATRTVTITEKGTLESAASRDVICKVRAGSPHSKNGHPLPPRSPGLPKSPDIPVPPFLGSRVRTDFDMREVFQYLNELTLFSTQWGFKKGGVKPSEYAKQIAETAEGLAVSAKGIDQSAEIIARDAEKIAYAWPAVERLGRLADRLPGGGRRSAAGR